jgi:hypothetical protein
LLNSPNAFMADIYDFLGVNPIPFKDAYKKLLPRPDEYIENYKELAETVEELESLVNTL